MFKVKRKSFNLVLLSTVFSLALVGCGNSNGGGDNSSEDQIDLEIFQPKVEIKDGLEELAEKYEEENPDVHIDVNTVGGGSDSTQELKTKFASGDEPEIYGFGGPTGKEEYKDNLADLSDTELADLAIDGTIDGMEEVVVLLVISITHDIYAFLYNKSVFTKVVSRPN